MESNKENSWSQSEEWESSNTDSDDQTKVSPGGSGTTAGSYHCKSALRTHESNMKLFLYKTSYMKLHSYFSVPSYNEECLLLLPDLWRSFYIKSHGLDRRICQHTVREHIAPTTSFDRWSRQTLNSIVNGDILKDILISEKPLWRLNEGFDVEGILADYKQLLNSNMRFLQLLYFMNLSLVVLNYRPSDTRPDVKVELPGIVSDLTEDIYSVNYNRFFKLYIHKECVRVITPCFDQILQKDIYLTLCDKINERFNVVIGSFLISRLSMIQKDDPSNYDTEIVRHVRSIISWGDNLLYKEKNNAYDLIGKYEAYCVSSILRYDDPMVWDNTEFQNNLLDDDRTTQPHLHPYAVELCTLLNNIPVPILAEVHGLWRIWGHPIIDLEGGMKKMETTCMKKHNVDKKETAIGERTFKMILMKNYYNKHGHYPLNTMTSITLFTSYRDHLSQDDILTYIANKGVYDERSYIHKCLREESSIHEKNSLYSHSDWDQVVLLQSFQIPHSINLATMIKDKAISQTRSELITSVLTKNSVFDSTKRRGVLKWLNEQTIRLKDYLLGIDKNGLPEDDRIIGLYPKERELKTKARFFSLMSYNMRMYITATEEILGKYLLPYFPMITMSDSLLNMIIRLYNMTTCIGASNSKVVYSMNIDFSKWNQNMREETNDNIFKCIDRFIGFRSLISRTHSIFRQSYLYLCSGEYVPTIIKGALTAISPYSRIGDGSGKEGLRQKGWTITTVCDIVSLAFLHGVAIELIGGGDNQVLTVEIRSFNKNQRLTAEEQMSKIKERMIRFRNALAKKMEKRGLPLKLEETWISHRLLMYNKIMYLDGVPLPGRLKVISRLFSNSNEGITTLGNITSTLGTGYQALSSKDYDPLLTWIISRTLTHINLGQFYLFNPISGTRRLDQQILRSKENMQRGLGVFGFDGSMQIINEKKKELISFSTDDTLSFDELFMICLFYHKILGGPGIGTPLSYIMKGFPDPLSEALCHNYTLMDTTVVHFLKKSLDCITSVEKSNIQHWEHLLEDPVSINHNAPAHGIAALRENAERVLKSAKIKNVQFKELISIGDTDYLRTLSATLCKPFDVEPRILHDVAGATIPGYVNTIISKVDQSSTINKLAADADVISSVYTSEVLYYMFLATKIKVRKGHIRTDCPTRDARSLRNTTWGRNIIGVTTPHPAGFLYPMRHGSGDTACDQNYISTLVQRSSSSYSLTRGPFKPYFGSYTSEKFKSGVLASAYGDEDLLKRSLKIQKLLGWRYQRGTMMYRIIQGILSCVTDADPNKFVPNIEEITGDVEHRYHDMATKHGGIPANLIKYYTWVSCNTTTFSDHSKGAANETLHFQASIIYCSMLSIIATKCSMKSTSICHYHEKCRECIQPITLPTEEDSMVSSIDLLSCPANNLMYVKEADIPVHYSNHISYLRTCEKTNKMRDRGGTVVGIDERQCRGTWLLLAVATLIGQKTLKRSNVRLLLDSLSYDEIVYLTRSTFQYKKFVASEPVGQLDACDVEDIMERSSMFIKEILLCPKVVTTLMEAGIPLYADQQSAVVPLLTMITKDISYIDDAIRQASGKYQDPEYQITRVLLLLSLNPSLGTCTICVQGANKFIQGEDAPACRLHGDLATPKKFHLYSLDKLGRYKGLPLIGTTGVTISRKRKAPSLLESIKRAKSNHDERQIKRRLGDFLYVTDDKSRLLMTALSDIWSKYSLNCTEQETIRSIRDATVLLPNSDRSVLVGGDMGEVMWIVQGILHCFRTISIHKKSSRATHRVSSSSESILCLVEITPHSDRVDIWIKALLLIDLKLAISRAHVPVILVPFIANIVDFESSQLTLLTEIVVGYNKSRVPTSKLQVYDKGDLSLDLNTWVHNADAIISLTVSAMGLTVREIPIYILTDTTLSHIILKEISESMRLSGNYQKSELCIILPDIHVTEKCPCIFQIIPSDEQRHLSEDLLFSSLMIHKFTMDHVVSDYLSDMKVTDHELSIYYCLYQRLVRVKGGVLSESLYLSIIQQLAGGLCEFALKSSKDMTLPWRCTAIIRMILALRILTDKDRESAISYYTALHSASYKVGTYKTVLLHKGYDRPTMGVCNWTPGTLGSRVWEAVKDMERWLVVAWKDSHTKTNKILL
ncbi:putative RNA-dependent RNA polymerase [Zhuye pepper nucleorhabdovirus]|uniref:RNA-directed RNA polymerase n=1 Tax=Zhuye pepper nucleorhabdovirus TaxID=2496274 RepID=A0A4P2UTG7_9RHAB|nr:putative RNA-dependent RNA polymerase [Green Sichuan pepper nucleorhabdovirus]AZN18347.1 putative RNA-dependent RNA polymerase [Zhuye pepper nucleorhabdovirus]